MLNILLAIQDQDSMALLSDLCQEKGCKAMIADTSSLTFENMLDQDIDILFLDLELLGLNIEDNLSAINEIMRELPIIIVGEEPDLSSEIKVRMTNIFYFALKPLNPVEIKQVLQAAINVVTSGNLGTEPASEENVISRATENKTVEGHRWFDRVINVSRSVIRAIPMADRKISNGAKLLIPNRLVSDLTALSLYVRPVDNFLSNTFRKSLRVVE